MAIFSGKVVSAKFIDYPNNMTIEILYKEDEDNIIPFVLGVDFTQQDFNDLLEECTLEEILEQTQASVKEEQKAVNKFIDDEINRRWENEQHKIKEAYDRAEKYAQEVIERELERVSQEHQKIEEAWAEIERGSKVLQEEYEKISREWQKIDVEYEKITTTSSQLEEDFTRLNQEWKNIGKEYERIDIYAENEKGKKLEEVQEEFKKIRGELQSKFNLSPGASTLGGKEVFSLIDKNNEDNDFVFNLKVSILEDPVIVKSKDKQKKLAIRKSKSVLELLKIYAEIKEAA